MKSNDAGKMIENEWLELTERFYNIRLHNYVVMPNHFHGILEITVGVPLVGTRSYGKLLNEYVHNNNGHPQGDTPAVGNIIGAFKSITTNKYISGVNNKNWERFEKKLWQRNFWEYIVRDRYEYARIAEYIDNNPLNWNVDKLNSQINYIKEDFAGYNTEIWMV